MDIEGNGAKIQFYLKPWHWVCLVFVLLTLELGITKTYFREYDTCIKTLCIPAVALERFRIVTYSKAVSFSIFFIARTNKNETNLMRDSECILNIKIGVFFENFTYISFICI